MMDLSNSDENILSLWNLQKSIFSFKIYFNTTTLILEIVKKNINSK